MNERSPWPIRFRNNTGETIPSFGLVTLEGSTTTAEGELVLLANLPGGTTEEAYFVNSANPVSPSGYGWARSIYDPPFWVKVHPSDSPGAGDTVGPEEDSMFASEDGDGFTVLSFDATEGIALCQLIGASSDIHAFSLFEGDTLEEGGESIYPAREGVIPKQSFDDFNPECGTFQGSTGFEELCPGLAWRGVAFGGSGDLVGSCDQSDYLMALKAGNRWFALGSGRTILRATANEDIDEGTSGSATAMVPQGGGYENPPGFCGAPDDSRYRQKGITIIAVGGDIASGDQVVACWDGREWVAYAAALDAELGCGLEEDEDGRIAVNNDELAGTGLDVEGTCSIRLSQDIIDRITELEGDVASLTTIVNSLVTITNDHETRITTLEECCEQNTQDIYECCADRIEIDMVYEVSCVDGAIVVEDKCVLVKKCPEA